METITNLSADGILAVIQELNCRGHKPMLQRANIQRLTQFIPLPKFISGLSAVDKKNTNMAAMS